MKKSTPHIKALLNKLLLLDAFTLREIINELKPALKRKQVANTLELPIEKVRCPHCKSFKKYKWGIENDMQRYRCKKCTRTYNILTGTPLAHLHRKGRWWKYAQSMSQGMTLQKAADYSGIHLTTAYRWRHRMLEHAKKIQPDKLNGIVESNVISSKWSFKGQCLVKATTPIHPPRSWIITGRDRNKNTTSRVHDYLNLKSLRASLSECIAKDALFCLPKHKKIRLFARRAKFRYAIISTANNVINNDKIIHLCNVSSYRDHYRNWMKRFKGVSTEKLPNYVAWYRQLDEHHMNLDTITILKRAHTGGLYHVPRQSLKE